MTNPEPCPLRDQEGTRKVCRAWLHRIHYCKDVRHEACEIRKHLQAKRQECKSRKLPTASELAGELSRIVGVPTASMYTIAQALIKWMEERQ